MAGGNSTDAASSRIKPDAFTLEKYFRGTRFFLLSPSSRNVLFNTILRRARCGRKLPRSLPTDSHDASFLNVMRVDAPSSSSFFFLFRSYSILPDGKSSLSCFDDIETSIRNTRNANLLIHTKRTWQRTRFQLLARRLMKSRSIKFDTAPTILRALTIRWINANYRNGCCVCVLVFHPRCTSNYPRLDVDDVYPMVAIARSSRSR